MSKASSKMLSSMVKDHYAKQAIKKEELGKNHCIENSRLDLKRLICNFVNFHFEKIKTDHHRKEAVAASGELTQALVDHLNVGYVELLTLSIN